MANTIDIGGLLNQAGGANGGLDVGSILNNANVDLNNLDLNNVDIGSIVDQINGGGDVDLETLLGMIPKDDNGKVKAEGLKELEKQYGITLGKILGMAGFGNNPQVVGNLKQEMIKIIKYF